MNGRGHHMLGRISHGLRVSTIGGVTITRVPAAAQDSKYGNGTKHSSNTDYANHKHDEAH
ncbi:hypothetical protein GCM10027072_74860 [Streptomyces bullii]